MSSHFRFTGTEIVNDDLVYISRAHPLCQYCMMLHYSIYSIGQESSRIWDQDYSLVIALGCPVEVRDVNEEKRLELETEKANLERALAGLKGLQ